MVRKQALKSTAASLALLAMLSNVAAAQSAATPPKDTGFWNDDGFGDRALPLTQQQRLELLRRNVKYVFVIFHENESFDHYFGTYPGANGLFDAPKGGTPANQTASFKQRYLDPTLKEASISPFLMPQAVTTAAGADRADLSRRRDFRRPQPPGHGQQHERRCGERRRGQRPLRHGSGRADHRRQRRARHQDRNAARPAFSSRRRRRPKRTSATSTATRSRSCGAGRRTSCCSTISARRSSAPRRRTRSRSSPDRRARRNGRCTPTRASRRPTPTRNSRTCSARATRAKPGQATSNAYVPVVADPGPFPGSNLDKNEVKPPYNFDEKADNPTLNLTFATQPLSFMGTDIEKIIKDDPNPDGRPARRAGRHQGNRRLRPPGALGLVPAGLQRQRHARPLHAAEHGDAESEQGPGPIHRLRPASQRPAIFRLPRRQSDRAQNRPPRRQGLLRRRRRAASCRSKAACSTCAAATTTTTAWFRSIRPRRSRRRSSATTIIPAYSDQQISEAFAAEAINAIANSPYWAQSAIIITYDETDGFYDHVAPEQRSTFGDGSLLAGGPAHSHDPDLAVRGVRRDLAPLQRARLGHQIHQRTVRPDAARRAAGRRERTRARQGQSRPGQSWALRRSEQQARRSDRGVRL